MVCRRNHWLPKIQRMQQNPVVSGKLQERHLASVTSLDPMEIGFRVGGSVPRKPDCLSFGEVHWFQQKSLKDVIQIHGFQETSLGSAKSVAFGESTLASEQYIGFTKISQLQESHLASKNIPLGPAKSRAFRKDP